uniref:G-protein coupled receptors family 1 profile domain-containing protein n=1 Tax=Plectus sambesii TaxID=2011161 RepID=A0A914W5N9_9BILA
MVSSILTLGIAWDRLHALLRPVTYRSVNHKRQMIIFLTIGIIVGLIIMSINLIDGDVHRVNPGCAAGGCFWSEKFRVVWTVGAIIINCITTSCTIALIVKVRQHQKFVLARQAATRVSTEREENVFMRIHAPHAGNPDTSYNDFLNKLADLLCAQCSTTTMVLDDFNAVISS